LRSLSMGVLPMAGRAPAWSAAEEDTDQAHAALYRLARELHQGGDALAGTSLLAGFSPSSSSSTARPTTRTCGG
jgi:hypothetical protein